MFVGRDREVGELVAGLARSTSGGDGSLYLLAGEPGIGKTRLAVEVATLARAQGVRASFGRCWEAGGAPAFWPWREALDGLGITFPEAGTIAVSDPAEARFALFRELVSALGREAALQPLLVVLEDLHAADRSSLLLLEFIAGQLRSSPIVVIGTYRDLEARLHPENGDALARLGRCGQVLLLSRLGEADVTNLVRHAIADADDRLTATVYETTHGNPLFIDEIVRDMRAHGPSSGMSIPLGVREVIRRRLSLCSEDARRVLEAGAVLGVEFGAAEVSRMVAGARAVLDDALRSGLVSGGQNRLRFSHALYREALYHDLPVSQRQALHRDAARALAATFAPLAETAHHLLESGPGEASAAIEHCILAAEQALDAFAFEDAAALLERAALALPHAGNERFSRARVLTASGEARIRSGDAAGRASCVEAAQIARELGDPELLARAGLGYGAVFTMGTVDPLLVGMLEEALALFPGHDSALRARVMARLGAARQPSRPEVRDRDIELALEAIAMARRVADPRVLLGVLHSASGALYGAADPRVRLPASREQERLAQELGDTMRLLHARVRIAIDLLELGDFASYAELASSYEQVANRIGRAASPWRVPLMRSMQALVTDRFDESERHQEEARRLEQERPAARRAQALHRIGFLRAAERHAELRASVPGVRSLWLEMPLGAVVAEPRAAAVFAHIGAEDEVRAILARLPNDAFCEAINSVQLGQAVWLTGNPAHAQLLVRELSWLAERWIVYWLDAEIVEAPFTRLLAYLAGILGDWKEADRLFAHALSAVESVGRRGMAARMRFELGDLLVRAEREPERARKLLAEARAGAEAVGLPELVALIDRRHRVADGDIHGAAPQRALTTQPAQGFAMVLEGEYYAVQVARGPLRFKANRGMQYLAYLVERPGVDVHVLELVGSSDHADRGDAGELLDAPALRAYRARLQALREAVVEAEARGETERAERAHSELEAIANELARSTGLGGQSRRGESAVDRARSAVQRRIKDALDRIAEQDKGLGSWLRRAIRTGNSCSYRPEP